MSKLHSFSFNPKQTVAILSILAMVTSIEAASLQTALAKTALETPVNISYFNDCHQNGGHEYLGDIYQDNVNLFYKNAAIQANDLGIESKQRQSIYKNQLEIQGNQTISQAKLMADTKKTQYRDVPQIQTAISTYLEQITQISAGYSGKTNQVWEAYQAEINAVTNPGSRMQAEIRNMQEAEQIEVDRALSDLHYRCGRTWPMQKTRDLNGAKKFITVAKSIDSNYKNRLNSQILYGIGRQDIKVVESKLRDEMTANRQLLTSQINSAKQELNTKISQISKIDTVSERNFCTVELNSRAISDRTKLENGLERMQSSIQNELQNSQSAAESFRIKGNNQYAQAKTNLAAAISAAKIRYQTKPAALSIIDQYNLEALAVINGSAKQFGQVASSYKSGVDNSVSAEYQAYQAMKSQSLGQFDALVTTTKQGCTRDGNGEKANWKAGSDYKQGISALSQDINQSKQQLWSNSAAKQSIKAAQTEANSSFASIRSELNNSLKQLKLQYDALLAPYRR